MATFYLMNNFQMGTVARYAGELVDDTVESTAAITAAGGSLLASGLTGLATAAGIAQGMKLRGQPPEIIEGVMLAWIGTLYVATATVTPTTPLNVTVVATNNTTALTTDGTAVTSDGTAVTSDGTTATETGTTHCGFATYTAPIAAELITVYPVTDSSNGVKVVAAQPLFPRKLQVSMVEGGAPITAGTLDFTGFDAAGEAIVDSVTIVGAGVRPTLNAYAYVTSMTVVGQVGGGAGSTISVGVTDAFGLPVPATATSLTIPMTIVTGTLEAVGTLDAVARSIDPTSAPNAALNFTFYYRYVLTATHNSHTHTVAAHTHTVAAHTHTVAAHTHTVAAHTHTQATHNHTQVAHTHTLV